MRGPRIVSALAAATIALSVPVEAAPPARTAAPAVERSVVRIVNYAQRGNWASPWDVAEVEESSGSGFVVAGGYVMTNAHVVSDSRLLVLFFHNDPTPHPAKVVHVAHDCDLALVRPEDPSTMKGIPALGFGDLPRLGSTVDTYGYPTGGAEVSLTHGVVSRIETHVYVHSGVDRHIVGQTDAAINPGNSGGPVVQEGGVVGVAFEANPDLQNVGFFVPTEVIDRFLRDVEDGRYDGYPELGVRTVSLDNPAARRKAGLAESQTGALVEQVYPRASAEGIVREGDVILAVDGRPVANDGSVADGDLRLPFGMLVDRKMIGEKTTLSLLRDGKRMEATVPLSAWPFGRAFANTYDRLPRYFIYAGLIFVPLELETLRSFGSDWAEKVEKPLFHELLFRPNQEPDALLRERVLLLGRLDDPVNTQIAWYQKQVVERINGKRIDKLSDVVEALESGTGDYDVIEFSAYRRLAVVDRREAARARDRILSRYGVEKDRRL